MSVQLYMSDFHVCFSFDLFFRGSFDVFLIVGVLPCSSGSCYITPPILLLRGIRQGQVCLQSLLCLLPSQAQIGVFDVQIVAASKSFCNFLFYRYVTLGLGFTRSLGTIEVALRRAHAECNSSSGDNSTFPLHHSITTPVTSLRHLQQCIITHAQNAYPLPNKSLVAEIKRPRKMENPPTH